MGASPGQTPASSIGQAMVQALARKGEPPGAARPRLDPTGGAAARNADRPAGRR